MKIFQAKVAVITGAGSGIGRALAVALNKAGADLALCDLNHDGMEETRTFLEDQSRLTSLHRLDVSDPAQMDQVAEDVLTQHKQVDILINNAGISLTPTPFLETSDVDFKTVLDINMWGVYNGIRSFLPHLAARPEASIVTISSLAGLLGLTGYSAYAMSKFAVRALSESLGMEYANTNTHFMVVHPGGVKTNLIKNAPDLGEDQRETAHQTFTKAALLTPEAAAQKILRGIQKKRNRLILGIDAKISYGIRRIFPRRYPAILNLIFSQMTFK